MDISNGVYNVYFIQVNNTNPPSYHVEYWEKTEQLQPAVRVWAKDFSCVDVPDPSPTPSDSASPGPSTNPSSTPPTAGDSPAPSAAPSDPPPNSPAPSSPPGAPSLSIGAPAFSPNGDGSNDGDDLTVSAKGPWSVEVAGHPGELGGAPADKNGTKSFRWDGKVNGILLPDGKYTVRVTTGSGVETADIIIDTTPPKASNIRYESDSSGSTLTITAHIEDPETNGVASGLKADPKDNIKAYLQDKEITFGKPEFDSMSGAYKLQFTSQQLKDFIVGLANSGQLSIEDKPLILKTEDNLGNKSNDQLIEINNKAERVFDSPAAGIM